MKIIEEIFNNNDLVPAIIQEAKTKKILMLAYMNKDSFNRTLKTRKTCFWSRSRKELWEKGKNSGNCQIVKTILVDCDLDTLLILVDQKGKGACHTGNYSCFYRTILD
jgi:phosphoribosyl-AMP cyclohydrolase